MLYISILVDLITDANIEEDSTISISEKEDLSTCLFLLEKLSLFPVLVKQYFLVSLWQDVLDTIR